MRLLLDTHALLWWATGDRRLTPRVRETLGDVESDVAVSAASLWEIASKRALGRIDVDLDELVTTVVEDGFSELPVRIGHTLALRDLPRQHDDPFDRLLIVQAIAESRRLVTHDRVIGKYAGLSGLTLFWE